MIEKLGSREGVSDAPLPSDGEVEHAEKVDELREELPYVPAEEAEEE